MPFTPKPFVAYYPIWDTEDGMVAIAHDEQSANAAAYALGGYSFDRQEDCNHGLSAWLCADPINHYPRDY